MQYPQTIKWITKKGDRVVSNDEMRLTGSNGGIQRISILQAAAVDIKSLYMSLSLSLSMH